MLTLGPNCIPWPFIIIGYLILNSMVLTEMVVLGSINHADDLGLLVQFMHQYQSPISFQNDLGLIIITRIFSFQNDQ